MKDLLAFVQDDAQVREERRKAKATRDKFVGLSSDEVANRYSENYLSDCRANVCMYVYSVVVMVCVEVLIFNCCVCTHVYVQPSPLHALHFMVYISMYVCMYVHNCVCGGRGVLTGYSYVWLLVR